MILLVILLIYIAVIIYSSVPLIRKINVFKRKQLINGVVNNVCSYLNINKKEMCKIQVCYNVNNKEYSKNFQLKKNECCLNIGDSITVLYNIDCPQSAHISDDYYSGMNCFKKYILILTIMAILSLGLRSILLYLYPAQMKTIISIFTFSLFAVITIIVLGTFALVNFKLQKSQNLVKGKILEKNHIKNQVTYKIIYIVENCSFNILYTTNEDSLEIGNKIDICYLSNAPFLARVVQ